MARTNNLTNFLNDVATAIKTKLGDNTPIPASQFDTKIGEIETGGTYQSKTINVTTNGSQTVTPDTGYDALSSVLINVQVPIPSLQTKNYEFTQNTHIVLSPEQGYDGFSSIDLTINVPTGTINNQDKTITENGTYTADSGYTGLGEVTVNVPSGSGDVKLFETVEQMEQDTTAQEGDLAIIYRDVTQPVQEDSEFSSCIFPDTVVLDEAFSGNINGSFMTVDQSVMFDGRVNMSSSSFRFIGWGESSQVRITYTSNDGITYTRTDGGEELQEFGTTIKWESWGDPFNSIIGNFMKIGGKYFDGLYECEPVDSDTDFLGYTNFVGIENNCTYDIENVPVSVIEQAYSLIPESDLSKLNEGFIIEYIDNNNLNFYYSGYTYSSQQYMACPKLFTPYNYTQDSKLYIATTAALVSNGFIKKMIIDIENESVTEELVPSTDVNNRNSQWVSNNSINTNNKWLACKDSDAYELEVDFRNSDGSVTGNGITIKVAYPKVDKYVRGSTQFTLSTSNQLLPDMVAYGKNGVVTGDGSIYNNLDQSQVLQNIYNLTPSQVDYYTGINKDTDLLLATRQWTSYNNVPEKFKTYKLLPLRETTDGENSDVILFPKDDLIIQPNKLRDIMSEINFNVSSTSDYLLSSSQLYFSSDKNYLSVYNKGYNKVWVIDIVNKTVITEITAYNVYSYKHSFYYNKNVWSISVTSPDYNIYVYDLDTRTESIVTTMPAIASDIQPYTITFTGNDNLLCYSYFSRKTNGSGSYYNEECQYIFIDMNTNTAQVPTKITHTQTSNYVGSHYLIVTPNSIIAAVRYYIGSSNRYYYTECTKELTVTTLLNGASAGSTMFYADYNNPPLYAIKNGNKLNILCNDYTNCYTLTINSSTSVTIDTKAMSNYPKVYLTKGGVPFIRLESNPDYYSLLTGIDTTKTMPLILDTTKRIYYTNDKFKVDGVSSGGISMQYISNNYSFLGWIDTSTMTYSDVHSGIIHIARSKPIYLKLDYTSEYDVLAINIGGPDETRLIPLNDFANNSEVVANGESE